MCGILCLMFLPWILAACTQQYQPAGPSIRAAALEGDRILMRDGYGLRVRITQSTTKTTATVIALHGINDYGHAFQPAATAWAREGITTYAYDQRGFGENANPGIWADVPTMTGDLRDVVDVVRAHHPDTPLYLVGESMGSAVVMTALGQDNPPEVDGAVLGAPAVWARQTMSGTYQWVLDGMRKLVPGLVLTGGGLGKRASDNNAVLAAMWHDPLVIKGARIDAIAGLVDLMDAAYVAAPSIRTPLLLLYGERDEIVPRHAVVQTVARLSHDPVIGVYPKGWHMLYRDLNSPILFNDVRHWIMRGGDELPSGAHSGRSLLVAQQVSSNTGAAE